jgi:hypothetical protein
VGRGQAWFGRYKTFLVNEAKGYGSIFQNRPGTDVTGWLR